MDTTLRDGAQALGITFSLQDKISIAERLDSLGFDYIEGGYPGSNPKDHEFFRVSSIKTLKKSKIVPFGSTRRKNIDPINDSTLQTLLVNSDDTVVIFGKSWRLHVEKILNTTLNENLKMISDSIEFFKENQKQVIFDAEHFFDGFKSDPKYALETIKVAKDSGAKTIVLCDTNGGTLTHEIEKIVTESLSEINCKLGIHCHNDSGLAVANTLAAVKAGVSQVHGTINGFGERCGNADLCQVIPAIKYKMNLNILGDGNSSIKNLKELTSISRYVYELTNIPQKPHQPYVGSGAFSHKAGMHVDAIMKNKEAYEHIDPKLVGNERKFLISELSGRSGILRIASELGLNLESRKDIIQKVLDKVKKLESEGYHLENADGSMCLIFLKELGRNIEPFKVKRWKVSTFREKNIKVQAEISVDVDGKEFNEIGVGVGPVHSLDVALRKALIKCFPELDKVRLVNYKVTVVDSVSGTASPVRVFIEFRDNGDRWATTSVSNNITEASETALSEGYIYWLKMKS